MTHARTLAAIAISSPKLAVSHLLVFILAGLSMTMGLPGTGTAEPIIAMTAAFIPVAVFPAWRAQLTTAGARLPLPVSPLQQAIVEALWFTAGTVLIAVLFQLFLVSLGGQFEPLAVAKGLLLVATPLPIAAVAFSLKPLRGGLAWAVAAPVLGLVLATVSLFFSPPDWLPAFLLGGGFAMGLYAVVPAIRDRMTQAEATAQAPRAALVALRQDTRNGIARAALAATALVPLSWMLATMMVEVTASAPEAITVLAILAPVGAILVPTFRPLGLPLSALMPDSTGAAFDLLPVPRRAIRQAISAHILTLSLLSIGLSIGSLQLLTLMGMASPTVLDLAGGVLALAPMIGGGATLAIARGWGPPSALKSAALAAAAIPAMVLARQAGGWVGLAADRTDVAGLSGAAFGGALVLAIAALLRWTAPR
jgi:hypothetical protein